MSQEYKTRRPLEIVANGAQGKRILSINKGVVLRKVESFREHGKNFSILEICLGVQLTVAESDLLNSGVFLELSTLTNSASLSSENTV